MWCVSVDRCVKVVRVVGTVGQLGRGIVSLTLTYPKVVLNRVPARQPRHFDWVLLAGGTVAPCFPPLLTPLRKRERERTTQERKQEEEEAETPKSEPRRKSKESDPCRVRNSRKDLEGKTLQGTARSFHVSTQINRDKTPFSYSQPSALVNHVRLYAEKMSALASCLAHPVHAKQQQNPHLAIRTRS